MLGAIGFLVVGVAFLCLAAFAVAPLFAGIDTFVAVAILNLSGLGLLVFVGWRLTGAPPQQVFPFRRAIQ